MEYENILEAKGLNHWFGHGEARKACAGSKGGKEVKQHDGSHSGGPALAEGGLHGAHDHESVAQMGPVEI